MKNNKALRGKKKNKPSIESIILTGAVFFVPGFIALYVLHQNFWHVVWAYGAALFVVFAIYGMIQLLTGK